jgi:hypothetical protein
MANPSQEIRLLDLSLQIVAVGDTTPREISAASEDLHDALYRLPGIASIRAVQIPSPDQTKGGLVDDLGNLAVSLVPTTLRTLLQIAKSVLSPHPQTKVVVKSGEVRLEFDPRQISLEELVTAAQKLRDPARSS